MTKRGLLRWVVTGIALTLSLPSWAGPNPAPPSVGPKAGQVSALLPVAKITRGTGRNAVTSEAKKGAELVWNDLIKTEKGGRARITLADQSILSLGSQAELRIVKHDARAQQTTLQMAYGRVRAQVASITRSGGGFEVRTPTAVAGVIGTDFGIDSSSVGGDTFICLAGAVQVSNSDPTVAGSVQCSAGQTTTVQPGKPPTPPQPASLQQLQQLIEDTEPAIIASIIPAAALPGTAFDSNIAGTKMGKVKSASVAGGSGVSATVKEASDTQVTIHVVVDAAAAPGPRTITLEKESGAASATVFTVLGMPIGDPKKAYLETLEQLRQTGVSGLGSFLTGAQQAADQVAQQISSANQNLPKPLDLTPFATSLNQQYSFVQGDLKNADTTITKAANDAANTFAQLYDSAFQALLQRDPTGTPDTTFRNALTAAFQQANTILQTAIAGSQTGLGGTIQTYGSSLDQIQQTWSQTINNAFLEQQAGPLPKVSALERIVELGSVAEFDAGNTTAANASISISSYKWMLCNQSYQPTGFGQLLPQNAPSCNSLQGFVSSTPEFSISTCNLQPGAYFARLEVTDSNNHVSKMDVKLTVLNPNYGSPSTAVQGLADSYSALQLSQFLRWFDSTQFNGYTVLAENIRKTLQDLRSMNINLRVSQENTTCNDATVRADWQQNYTFNTSPDVVLTQAAQLSVRLQRTPGVGWLITDFQGDNGTVQGVPPVISNTDVAAPDLIVTSVVVGGGPVGANVRRNAVRVSGIEVPVGSDLSVSPGEHVVQATVENVGQADLVLPLDARFELQDAGGTTVGSAVTAPIPLPLAAGNSSLVTANVNFPDMQGLRLVVTANPTNLAPERDFANNFNAFPVAVVQQPDLALGAITVPAVLQMGSTFAFDLQVGNSGLSAPSGWDIRVTVGGKVAFIGTGPAVATGQTVTIPIQFPVPVLSVAPADLTNQPFIVQINANDAFAEPNKANNTNPAQTSRLVDFAVTTVPTAPLIGVVGRPFSTVMASVAPSPYPLPVTFSYGGLFNGLAGTTATVAGTPTAPGSTLVSVGATASGVTHFSGTNATIQINPEITITPVITPPAFVAGGAAQDLVLGVAGGVYPVTVALTLPTGFTTTSGTVNGNIATVVLAGPGNAIYSLTASANVTFGNQNFTVVATDAGVTATGTPAGNVSVLVPYSVGGLPDLQFGSVVVPTALQMGATINATIPVVNTGSVGAVAGWNLVVTINGLPAGGNPNGPPIPADGVPVDVPIVIAVPQVLAPPANVAGSGTIVLNTNQAIQELSTANNTFTTPLTLVDFALNTIPTGTSIGVVGRSFSLLTVDVQPTPYPVPVQISYLNLPTGLAPTTTTTPNGLTGATIAGTPTAAGAGDVSIIGTTGTVSHGANTPFQVSIANEISISQTNVPSLLPGGPGGDLALNVTGGIYPVTLALTLPPGLSTTSGTLNGNISTITLTGPGPVAWFIAADLTAVSGSNLPINIVATDQGFLDPRTLGVITPPGNVPFTAQYSNGVVPSYVLTSVSFVGHNTPYINANALQIGEVTQLRVVVTNVGAASGTGTVTLSAACDRPECSDPLVISGPAPAAGVSIPIDLPINVDMPVGNYIGTVTITTDVVGAVVGPPQTVPFDVVDFTFSANTISPAQNLLVGGSGDLSLSLAVQVPLGGTPFGIQITPASDPDLTFTPPSATSAGALIPFTVNVNAAKTPGIGLITFNATNFGVTKSAIVPVQFFTASLTPTRLFVNDPANPLSVPIALGAQPPQSYPTINLKMNGDFLGGAAALNVRQPACGNFVVAFFPTIAQPNDTVDMPIYAASGNTCPPGTPVVVTAQIPNTNPATSVDVFTLYVEPTGLPQLEVLSADPSRDLSQLPWLSGEPLDWNVTIRNNGNSATSGGERITIYLNGAEVGSATIASPIGAGQQASFNVHTVASDVPEDRTLSFGSVRVNVSTDARGDLAPGSQDLNLNVLLSNWGIQVNGAGSTDALPLQMLVPNTTSNTADISVKNPSGFNPNIVLSLVPGVISNGLNPPSFVPAILDASGNSFVTVSYPGTSQPYDGRYLVQVIAQMKDGGTVTAQRQATIHVLITNQSRFPSTVILNSDANNIANCFDGCGVPNNTVQINGPLPEQFTLTASLSFCSGSSCPGTADVSFTDTYMTETSPSFQTVQVEAPGNSFPVRVKAGGNPDGSITTGPAMVDVSVTSIQATSFPFAARTPGPDPVGNNRFIMTFNIGDIFVNTSSCIAVSPGDPAPTDVFASWFAASGFNSPSLAWEWQDANHVPVGAGPLAFDVASGTSTFSGNGYSSLPTFKVTNVSNGIDGLQTYYLAVTISNGIGTATKYYPIDFDLSQSQTFCPILNAARGSVGGTLIKGSWGKSGLMGSSPSALKVTARAASLSTKLPDLRISASDVSYTPSIPKSGDTVSVRFRVTNAGDADAKEVPIALQINGTTVASDTFDVPAGRTTLAGLEWTNATAPQNSVVLAMKRPVRPGRDGSEPVSDVPISVAGTTLQAALVIDPQRTVKQKSATAKTAALANFRMRSGGYAGGTMASVGEQRVVLQLSEGGCAGLKFALGAGSCAGSGDVTITVEDLAKGSYKLEAMNGIADLGVGNNQYTNASFGPQVLGQSGHTYAVQLNDGKVGLLTMTAVRNPDQLSEAAKRIFRQTAARMMRKLGSSTGAPDAGDTAGRAKDSIVYFDIVYQGQ